MQTQFDTEAQLIQEVSNNPGVIRTYLEGMVPSLLSFLVQLIVAILVLLIGSRIVNFCLNCYGSHWIEAEWRQELLPFYVHL